MSILATKLYIPPPRSKLVRRTRLIERLNEGKHRKLTLISGPAGFGKTMLVSEWIAGCKRPAAWFSMDEGDNDPIRFLTYFVSALQTISAGVGGGVLGVLQSTQPPPTESILTVLLNEITAIPGDFTLVLDDYHAIDAKPVDEVLTFLLDHLPPQMHLVIATREDPYIPLARLRAQGQLAELRAADLCFTPTETAGFLNNVMGLDLSAEDIAALDTRTEGWIAGLQLAAISMQGHKDISNFIKSFNGSHYFVMDYLVEEVLQQQPERVQTFLLRTSILDRLCGPLCDAVLPDPSAGGQETLEYLQHANLFIVPLDDERRWYRYHHLFADLLRQRLSRSAAAPAKDEGKGAAEYHARASQWYEDNGLELEAFKHAVAANDVDRTARLVEGKGMPLHFRGALAPVLNWLQSLPKTVLDARPSLWVMYASALSMTGQTAAVEQKLLAAEAALQEVEPDDRTRNLVGHIAAIRALLAATQNQVEAIITQSRRALEYLHPGNLAVRTATIWKLGIAYQLQGDRAAAARAYSEAISVSQSSGNTIINTVATIGLGNVQETENQLYPAAENYKRVLKLMGDMPSPFACEAHLGLTRIFYQWNDFDAAEQHGQQSVQIARQIENTERFIAGELETVTTIAIVIGWLFLTILSQQYIAGAPDASYFQTLGTLTLKENVSIGYILQIVFPLGALMFYCVLYQAKLIPRWISGWGLIAAILVLALAFLDLFGIVTSHDVLDLPIFLQEMVMAVWLIVKGFNPSGIESKICQ
ncbi:MAG TPA: LuxR family transcriptional regulator [Desulfotomaculum sp.]|nr:MAG: ATP-dependent transcriptional regulator, MalT-like, LuxR family protein [Desulfotomaculum sp. 46_80]HAG11463.1 LuxR family transcriptional regulator [Desulfotomaculum sp.]HBY03080.1 LuxR family transcriptional regulator [Desulfotomaculum sp.]